MEISITIITLSPEVIISSNSFPFLLSYRKLLPKGPEVCIAETLEGKYRPIPKIF